jgi:hypothetical protein
MDTADPIAHARLTEVLDRETGVRGMSYHSLRHRNLECLSGVSRLLMTHLIFRPPVRGCCTVSQYHCLTS